MTSDGQGPTPIERARQLARSLHRPVYITGDEVVVERPRGAGLTVWPNGSVSMGTANTQQTAKDVERRYGSPAA